ncbi:MAG: hypothetical protein WCJ61_17025, partial [Paludibacter sp.]
MKKNGILVFFVLNIVVVFSQDLKIALDTVNRQTKEYQQKQHINYRGNLDNSRLIFENDKVGRVA